MSCAVFMEIMYRQIIHVLCYFRGDHISTDYSFPVLFSWRPCIDRLFMSCAGYVETIFRLVIHVLCCFFWRPRIERLFTSCAVFVETMYRQVIHVLFGFHGNHVSTSYSCTVLFSWRPCIYLVFMSFAFFQGDHVPIGYSCLVLFLWKSCIDSLFMSCAIFEETIYQQIIHVL